MIDLDAARAARKEANGEGPVVRFGGQDYELPAELPFAVLEAMRGLQNEETAAASIVEMTEALLGPHYAAIRAAGLSVDDMNELVGGVLTEYGVDRPLPSSAS